MLPAVSDGDSPPALKNVPKRDHGPKYNHHFIAMIVASPWCQHKHFTKKHYIYNLYIKHLTSDSDGSGNVATHNVMLSAFFAEESKSGIEHCLLLFTG